jgi:hypothetical protein
MTIECPQHGRIEARECLLRHIDARAGGSNTQCAACPAGPEVRRQSIEKPDTVQPVQQTTTRHAPDDRAAWRAAYQRICDVTGRATQVELAEELGIRQSSISDAKRRASLPASWLLTILQRYQVNPHWILTGSGCKYMLPSDSTTKIQLDSHIGVLRDELRAELVATRVLSLEQATAALMAHYPAGTTLDIKFHQMLNVPDRPHDSGMTTMGAA